MKVLKLSALLFIVAVSAKAQMSFNYLERQFLVKMSFSTVETNASKHGFVFKKTGEISDSTECRVYYVFEKVGESLAVFTKCSKNNNFMMVDAVKLVLYDRDEFNRYLDECRADKEITFNGEYSEGGAVSYLFGRNNVVQYRLKITPGQKRVNYSIQMDFTPTYR